jgi:benzoate membrane transport protein
VAIPIAIFSLVALALPLATAASLRLSPQQTSAWLLALYGVPALLSLALTRAFRQPLLVAWHTAVVAFLATLGQDFTYREIRGAMLVGGLAVAALGALGLTARVAALVPAPVVMGVVAANVLPFVVGIFDALGDARLVVGGVLVAYLLGRRFLGARVPPILPALLAGLAVAAASGQLAVPPSGWTAPAFAPARPAFSAGAIATLAPVVVVLVALHSNLTAAVYLRAQAYRPPVRAIDGATGLGTAVAALLGPAPICMGALVTPLTAGPEAGDRPVRPWSAYLSGVALGLIAIGAGVAAVVPRAVPLPLLLAVAGLALLGVLGQALAEVTQGPLRVGPLVAVTVALSHLRLLDLGPPFWALVFGSLTSLLLEADALREVRTANRPEGA